MGQLGISFHGEVNAGCYQESSKLVKLTSSQKDRALYELLESYRNIMRQNHAVDLKDISAEKQDVLKIFGGLITKLPEGVIPWARA